MIQPIGTPSIKSLALNYLSEQKQVQREVQGQVQLLEKRPCFIDEPTPAQLEQARALLVLCPSIGRKLHCWHCTRCEREMKCMAWRHLPPAEMRFQRSAAGKTFSVELAERLLAMEAEQ